jgi:hypothetical protein
VPPNEADADSDGYRVCQLDCDDNAASIHPGAAEQCNGLDDNCDAATDEGCPCTEGATQPCGTDVGACEAGLQTCSGGAWAACTGAVVPIAELCNGVDDDCDGNVPAHEADGDGDGARICDGDCNDADAAVHPGADELCNGIDDNCDNVVDENCGCDDGETRPCGSDEGACEQGTEQCAGSVWGECLGGIGPVDEICDGVDNDCDAVTDEDCSDAGADAGADADTDSGAGGSTAPGNEETVQGVLTGSCGCRLAPAPVRPGPLLGLLGLLLLRRRTGRSRAC